MLVAPGTNASTRMIREETLRKATEALAKLSAPDREVLVLRHLEHLSTREIAAVLGISEGAVKVRRFRALQRLRALLGDEIEEDEP